MESFKLAYLSSIVISHILIMLELTKVLIRVNKGVKGNTFERKENNWSQGNSLICV